jgi:hypothetical protein
MALRIVRIGTWLYDGAVPRPVDIVALDYDWWYELGKANGDHSHDEKALEPDAQGWIYYVRFRNALNRSEPTSVDSPGHNTIAQAMAAAEAKVHDRIRWNDGDA